MIKIIKKGERKEKPVAKQTRKPANFWVLESLKTIEANKQAESKRFFRS